MDYSVFSSFRGPVSARSYRTITYLHRTIACLGLLRMMYLPSRWRLGVETMPCSKLPELPQHTLASSHPTSGRSALFHDIERLLNEFTHASRVSPTGLGPSLLVESFALSLLCWRVAVACRCLAVWYFAVCAVLVSAVSIFRVPSYLPARVADLLPSSPTL